MAAPKPRRMPVSASDSTPRDKEMLEILLAMNAKLASLDTKVEGINERLDKLNGSVARHETRIGSIEKAHNVEDGAKKANSTWMKILWPVLCAIGGGAITVIVRVALENGPSLLKALPK